jgi:hypothetical protein
MVIIAVAEKDSFSETLNNKVPYLRCAKSVSSGKPTRVRRCTLHDQMSRRRNTIPLGPAKNCADIMMYYCCYTITAAKS